MRLFYYCLIFVAPAAVCIAMFAATGCSRSIPPNQQSPVASPDGRYVLTVPVACREAGGFLFFRAVTISNRDGSIKYRDNRGFPARFNVYWIWDTENRVWLYNSDDGTVWFWEKNKMSWNKVKWGHGHTCTSATGILPPEALYPPYAK